ncbi:hypothetical protein PF003_g40789 [Phytophthora fragariae]|nr:hypothetical protein PF003_g40789 [Phytophthora fragariae]
MIRQTRNPNYTSADVDRLLLLIENELPLGRDEWESLATSYNANRPRGAPERDFESLRRKFKVLYSTRKLTGMPNMPPLVKEAK